MTKHEPNIEAINNTIESIRAEKIGFDAGEWKTPTECGTVACIAGHAIFSNRPAVWDSFGEGYDDSDRFVQIAGDILGINGWPAIDVYFNQLGMETWRDYTASRASDITPAVAIESLEHFRDTGELRFNEEMINKSG